MQHINFLRLLLNLFIIIVPLILLFVIFFLVVKLLNLQKAFTICENINDSLIKGAEDRLWDIEFYGIWRAHFYESMKVLVCFEKDANDHIVGTSSANYLLFVNNLILYNFQILLLQVFQLSAKRDLIFGFGTCYFCLFFRQLHRQIRFSFD